MSINDLKFDLIDKLKDLEFSKDEETREAIQTVLNCLPFYEENNDLPVEEFIKSVRKRFSL